MKWTVVDIVATPSFIENIEIILLTCGISGWQIIENETVRFYVTDSESDNELVEAVKTGIKALNKSCDSLESNPISICFSHVDDDNWHETWKSFFKPLDIGENIVIKPVWEEYNKPDKLIFKIEPGNVFGTGLHESTQLCLAAVERLIKPGDIMMDIGCGSGILSIIGLMLGAKSCVAVDHNPDVKEAINKNATLNSISLDRLDVRIGDFLESHSLLKPTNAQKLDCDVAFDCIVANIEADTIISLIPLIIDLDCLKKDGFLIVSGIINERLNDVLLVIEGSGLKTKEIEVDGEWACIVCSIRLF
jgi:ribosomal protein L11 methyltransferase